MKCKVWVNGKRNRWGKSWKIQKKNLQIKNHWYTDACPRYLNQQGEWTLEKTEDAVKNGQSRDTGNIGHTRHGTKTKHNTIGSTDPTNSGMNPGAQEI